MTINSSNRSALSAVTVKVLWRTGGVDDFIGKVSFLCRRREQLSLYLTESKYFSMYMFACMGWCSVSKSQRYCVSKERNTTTNCIQFYLQQADIVHELKRPNYLFILIKLASSYPLPLLTWKLCTKNVLNAKRSLYYVCCRFYLKIFFIKLSPQPSTKHHCRKSILSIFTIYP